MIPDGCVGNVPHNPELDVPLGAFFRRIGRILKIHYRLIGGISKTAIVSRLDYLTGRHTNAIAPTITNRGGRP
jgi:hypothetical protein